MVFTIGNDDDGLADAFLLGKTVRRHRDSLSDVCTLCGYHRGVDAGQEHLGRDVVAGDRQLDEGVTGKDDKSYLVVGEVVNEVLDHHLRTVQTTGRHIFCQHGVTDIHRDDGLYACTLLVANLSAKLRTRQHDDEQG